MLNFSRYCQFSCLKSFSKWSKTYNSSVTDGVLIGWVAVKLKGRRSKTFSLCLFRRHLPSNSATLWRSYSLLTFTKYTKSAPGWHHGAPAPPPHVGIGGRWAPKGVVGRKRRRVVWVRLLYSSNSSQLLIQARSAHANSLTWLKHLAVHIPMIWQASWINHDNIFWIANWNSNKKASFIHSIQFIFFLHKAETSRNSLFFTE